MKSDLLLTRACWPVFEATINVARLARDRKAPAPERARSLILSALRDADDLARQDPDVERAWRERIRAMLIYFIDHKLVHIDWPGREFWLEHRLETDPAGLDEVTSEGGNKFFEACDLLQKIYEPADLRKRDDAPLLAEQLALYYACIRLGFEGQFQGQPDELTDYTRRLYLLLPEQRDLRDDRLFPGAYEHTEERPARYRLGMPVAIVLTVFIALFIAVIIMYRVAWNNATGDIRRAAESYDATAVQCMDGSGNCA